MAALLLLFTSVAVSAAPAPFEATSVVPESDMVEEGATASAGYCPMAYHMGAMLDVAEKTCEATKEVSACASAGSCSKWVELKTLVSALDPRSPEAVWKVCCFRAYKIGGYQTCHQPSHPCTTALEKHVLKPLKLTTKPSSLAKALTATVTVSNKQQYSKKLLPRLHDLLARIQAARGELWKSHAACHKLAPPTPAAKCGFGGKKYDGQYHSLDRTDLYCETIEWQYKEMGAGDEYMKHCPGAKFRSHMQNLFWNRVQDAEIKKDLGIVIPEKEGSR